MDDFVGDGLNNTNSFNNSISDGSTNSANSTQEDEFEDDIELEEFVRNVLPLKARLTEVEPSSNVELEFSRPIDVHVGLLNVTREGRRLETDEEIEERQGQFVALEDLSQRQIVTKMELELWHDLVKLVLR